MSRIPVLLLLVLVAIPALSAPPLEDKLYTTSWFSRHLAVLDLASGKLNKVPVGYKNHNAYLSPDKKELWVTNNNADSVSILDTATDTVVADIHTGLGPRHTFFHPDGHEAYVTNEYDNSLAIVDARERKVVTTISVGHMPHFAIYANQRIYVTNMGADTVTVINRDSAKVEGHIQVGLGGLGASKTKDDGRILVACNKSNLVAVIDTHRNRLLAQVATDPGPVQVTVAPSQRYAYVTNDGAGTVQKIDLQEYKVVKTITLGEGRGSHGISFAKGGDILFVTNTGDGTVSVIDTVTDSVIDTLTVLSAPEGVAYLP